MSEAAENGSPRTRWAIIVAVVAVALLVSVAFFLYQRQAEDARLEDAVVTAVAEYNEGLAAANAQLDPDKLARVTDSERTRLETYLVKLHGEGRFLVSELKSAALVGWARSGNSVAVEMDETWAFQEYDRETKEPVTDIVEQRQRLRYTLVLQEGEWRVDRAEVLEPEGR